MVAKSSTVRVVESDKDTSSVHPKQNDGTFPDNLRILVCTGNLGNAVPTEESFAAWLPKDGSVDEVLQNCVYPLREGGPTENDFGGQFDVIAIGMQEAVFITDNNSTKRSEATNGQNVCRSHNSSAAIERTGSDRDDIKQRLATINEEASSVSISNIKLASLRRSLNRIDYDSLSDDSLMSLLEKDENCACTCNADDTPAIKKPSLITRMVEGVKAFINPLATCIMSVAGYADHSNEKLTESVTWVGGSKKIYGLCNERMGDGYHTLVRYQRGEMRLIILVRKELRPFVTGVQTLAENTGIAGVVANKGGIITTLTFGGITRVSFLTAHLEAHEGKEHYKNRCANLEEILWGARKGQLDVSITSHHIIAMGDLNFRVQLPPPEGKEKWKGIAHRSKVRDIVDAQNWTALNDADELNSALEKGECLAGFETLPCNFHPTFKVEREAGFKYQEKRTPSYTDRILWKSVHGRTDNVRPLMYEPVSNFITSDHKPVRGAFSVAMTSKDRFVQEGDPGRRANLIAQSRAGGVRNNLHIFISNITCTDLIQTWQGRKNQTYILFAADPKELMREKVSVRRQVAGIIGLGNCVDRFSATPQKILNGYVRTPVHKRNGENPVWKDTEIHLQVKDSSIRSPKDLAGDLLYLKVYDEMGFRANQDDYLIGTVALDLQQLSLRASDGGEEDEGYMSTIEIDERIVKNGKDNGRLTCTITNWWLFISEESQSKLNQ